MSIYWIAVLVHYLCLSFSSVSVTPPSTLLWYFCGKGASLALSAAFQTVCMPEITELDHFLNPVILSFAKNRSCITNWHRFPWHFNLWAAVDSGNMVGYTCIVSISYGECAKLVSYVFLRDQIYLLSHDIRVRCLLGQCQPSQREIRFKLHVFKFIQMCKNVIV